MTQKDLLPQAISFSQAGFRIFKVSGKIPAEKWREGTYIEPQDVEEYLKNWTGNYGIAPNKNQLVVDIDPRNYVGDDKPHKRLFDAMDVDPKGLTTVVKTGGGGLHMYFTLPDLPEGRKIRKNHPDYKGIDFISEGSFVVGAGSIHPVSGMPYVLDTKNPSPESMAEAPQALIDIITSDKLDVSDLGLEEGAIDDDATIMRYKVYLQTAQPAVEGAAGDAHTFRIACKGRDFGLSAHKTLELMAEDWNIKCEPMWEIEDLKQKVSNAYNYASKKLGSDHPAAEFDPVHGKRIEFHPNWRGWDLNPNTSKKENTVNNTINFFINQHEDPENPLLNSLVYNEFTQEIGKTKWLPWDKDKARKFPAKGVEWTDMDTVNLRSYLSTQKKYHIGKNDLEDAIKSVASFKSYHPVKEYLQGLKWDGLPRLGTWLIKNTGARDIPAHRELSRIAIMQAVARIYTPGAQCDMVIILEGEQGIGKSQIVRTLGGEWYADIIVDPSNKDTAENMRGKWILEMSEMKVLRKRESDELKSFITKTTDRFRPAYARRSIDMPRQCIYIGTINKDDTGQYFTDSTGNRRFGPIDLGKKAVNVKGIRKIRDQLFAEAAEKYLSGEPHHTTDRKLQKLIEKEQASRMSEDPWLNRITSYIELYRPYHASVNDVWVEGLCGDIKQLGHVQRRRIATCLGALGYYQGVKRVEGKPTRGFFNDSYKANDAKDLF